MYHAHALLSKPLLRILAAIIIVCVIFLLSRERLLASDAVRPYMASIAKLPAISVAQPAPTGMPLDTIKNSTLGFEKLFVISLPSRPDRRDGMVLQASLSDITIDFIDGVQNSQIAEKAIPKAEDGTHVLNAALGAWRAHINAIQEIVRRNITSAFIMEDDGDWDVQIKHQLQNVAKATRALIQPLAIDSKSYADPTFPRRPKDHPPVPDIMFETLPNTLPPQISPYGDDWDVLWVGHCGQSFPRDDNEFLPRGRVIQRNDSTVPKKEHLESPFIQPFTLKDDYPDHTRAIHHSQWGVCSSGYAVSQRGARRILLEIGLKEVIAPFDLLLPRPSGRGKRH
ncbi:hypothetical protein CDD81_689 [Ophiocordyceps australis]|uniref:Glycosyl transferase family 25 domain-containing protein n=1 Tax=Ophiocordyceps australis TaxID=1399860 RepID=A0A2C5XFZ2_9HYPO|nr:hypothetical protein CDD81_689 [Ophiocordyceps australis]